VNLETGRVTAELRFDRMLARCSELFFAKRPIVER
jgi:hypothetical protein